MAAIVSLQTLNFYQIIIIVCRFCQIWPVFVKFDQLKGILKEILISQISHPEYRDIAIFISNIAPRDIAIFAAPSPDPPTTGPLPNVHRGHAT